MQKLTDPVVVQLNDLPGFPARPNTNPPAPDRWLLGDWLVECHVAPEVANFAALPLTGNRTGDVRVSLADQAWYIWDGAVWQPMAGGGGGVASVGGTLPLVSSGGVNPVISITAGTASGELLTWDGLAWVAAAAPVTPAAGGLGDVQLNDGANGFTASTDLSFNALVLTVTNRVDVTDGANILTLTKDAVTTDAATLTVGAPTAAVNISGAFTLPTTDGSSGDVLTTDGAGTVLWAAPAAASSSTDVTGYVAKEALNAGDLVRFTDDVGTPKVQKADATNTDARLNPVGFAVAAAAVGGAVTVRVAGVADVPAARFDVPAPAVTDVGKRVFVSTTSGQITLTAPSVSGDILQRAGVLVDGSGNPKVLVQVGDPTLL